MTTVTEVPVLAPISDDDRRIAGAAEYLQQPLANYGARLREHYTDLTKPGLTHCTCGYAARSSRGRGIHETAEAKRAGKLYDAECALARQLARAAR